VETQSGHITTVTSDTAKATPPDGLEAPRRYWAVAALMGGLILASLDTTMSNVALPRIATFMGVNPGLVVWVGIAYSLAVVVSILPFSAVAERIGFRRMYAVGLTVFMLSAIGCALSTSLWSLIVARVCQGFGTSMLMCLFGGLVRNIYPLRMMGFGISLNALMVALIAVLGPVIGAFILEYASWQWIFVPYIPVCLITYFWVPYLPDVSRTKRPFDWWACLLSIVMFGLMVIGLDTLTDHLPRALACLAVAALAAYLLLRHSRGQAAPFVPVDLLRIQPVAFAVAASACSFAAQMSSFVALPFYFLDVMHYSYGDIGILLGGWSVGVAIMAPVAGMLADRFQVAVLCGIGALCMAAGLAWVLVLPLDAGFIWLLLAMLLAGVGFGFFQSPNNRALLVGAPRRRSGAAGALQATTRVFGQSVGTALVAIGFNLSASHGAAVGIGIGVVCACGALAVNIMRYFNPAPDMEL